MVYVEQFVEHGRAPLDQYPGSSRAIRLETPSFPQAMEIPGYRIERLIAEGGMARVHLAVQESLHRPVALKPLRKSELSAQTERFLNDAHIITIHDVGIIEGRPYISMEYREGGDMDARFAQGMTADEALDLIESPLTTVNAPRHPPGAIAEPTRG